MGTLASNLLMCTCAGAVGVAAVPVAKKVNHAVARKPAVSRTVAQTANPMPIELAKAADCKPLGINMAALAPITGQEAPPTPDLPDLTGFASGAGQQMANLLPPAGTSGNMALSGMQRPRSLSGTFLPAGSAAAAPPSIEDVVVVDTDFTDPSTTVPEPGMWVIMVSGFGVVGIAMRGRRNTVTASV